jgi:hypothetical protein
MQYKSAKIALLAIALFGTSALATPFAGDAEYDIEARDVDNELAAREFFEMNDVEAREPESATVATPRTPQTPQTPETPQTPQTPLSGHSTNVESHEHGHEAAGAKHEKVFLTKHQKSVHRLKKLAAKKFEDVDFYHKALKDKESKYHRFAVSKHLSKPKNLKKALANKKSPYHKAAKHIIHVRKAKIYLEDDNNFVKALKHKHNKYHKDAVKKYFSHGTNYQQALIHKSSPFHKAAVHEYLLDKKNRKRAIANLEHPFHKQAVKMQKKINKHHKHTISSDSLTGNSTTTATPNA